MKTAIELITEERKRQIEVKGYTPEHDDMHTNGELAMAAATYAATPNININTRKSQGVFLTIKRWALWPFELKSFKPSLDNNRKRDLIKSVALMIAEIERLQRLEEKEAKISKLEVIQVCGTDCDNKPYQVEVKSHSYTFCCQKGFEKSLKDFAKTQGGKK